ncbi:unnamed protein product [Symbiodinium sp. KB8]|nr:unnamed protein product [Symbiodinium sp. KB8]
MLAKLAAREATRRWGRMQDVADILHSEEQSDREKQDRVKRLSQEDCVCALETSNKKKDKPNPKAEGEKKKTKKVGPLLRRWCCRDLMAVSSFACRFPRGPPVEWWAGSKPSAQRPRGEALLGGTPEPAPSIAPKAKYASPRGNLKSGRESSQAAMPVMRNAESKRIQYLRRQLRRGHSEKGREFTEEDKQQMQAALDSEIAKRKEGTVKRLEKKMETEQDRGMAHMTAECAVLNEKLDRALASRSSGSRDPELVQRLLGEPGSVLEIQADINVRKEDLKRKRQQDRADARAAEKRRKALEPFEIPLQGDVKQDGVVLRGELGREKLRGFQGDAVFKFGGVHCRLVELGAQATLQLEPFSAEQMESLETMLQNGFECKVLAVTKKAVVEARLNPNGKVRDVATNRIISAASLLTLRFTTHRFTPVEFLPVKVETQAPSEVHEAVAAEVRDQKENESEAEVRDQEEPEAEVRDQKENESEAEVGDQEENESEAEVGDQEPEAAPAEEEPRGEWKMTVQGRTVSFDFVKNALFTCAGPVREVKVVGPEAVEFLAKIAPGPQSPDFHRAQLQHIEGDLFLIHPKLWSQEVTRLRAAAEETAALDDDLDESAEKPVPAPAEESREIKEPEPVEETAALDDDLGEARDQRRVQGFVGEVGDCGWLELFLDDEVCYDDARGRVVSGLLHGWVSGCEMILGEEVTQLKELPEFGRLRAGGHDGDVEIVEGLRVRRVGDELELAARTLEEYAEDLKILTPKLADGTFVDHRLRWAENKWASELFEINAGTGKLFQRKGRRSVNPEQGDMHRSGRPPGVSIPLKSLWADSPGVQRAPKSLTAAVAAVAQLKPCILLALAVPPFGPALTSLFPRSRFKLVGTGVAGGLGGGRDRVGASDRFALRVCCISRFPSLTLSVSPRLPFAALHCCLRPFPVGLPP